MTKLPAVRSPTEIGKAEGDLPQANPNVPEQTPFFSFRYSYTEVRAFGSTARIKAREMRLEDGVIESHSFEGTCDRRAYDDLVQQMQRQLFAHTAFFLKAFSWFLPHDKSRGK